MGLFIVALPFLSHHDAVSNDARVEVDVLCDSGAQVALYAELFEPGCEGEAISRSEFERHIADPTVTLIYHMCVAWALLDQLLPRLRCRLILRYHNITPPSFFDPYDRESAHATRAGLAQARTLLTHPRSSGLMVTSPSTLAELTRQWGEAKLPTVTVAPFLALPTGTGPNVEGAAATDADDPLIAAAFGHSKVRLLFVGRWVPNKGHEHLIGVLSSFRELYGDGIELHIAGKVSPNFVAYQNRVLALAKDVGAAAAVRLWPTLSERQLLTAYRKADALLVLSEHEGFCVPVIEAQSLGLPVIAWENTAVGTTLGEGQLSSPQLDYDFFAAAAWALREDADLRRAVTARGYANAERYSRPRLAAQFLAATTKLSATDGAAYG